MALPRFVSDFLLNKISVGSSVVVAQCVSDNQPTKSDVRDALREINELKDSSGLDSVIKILEKRL